jgi:hypothetical protein
MVRSWIMAALLAFAPAGSAGAQEPMVDAAYQAEHDGWITRCVEKLGDRHGGSCLIERQDEASGLSALVVAFPESGETVGELWLVMPAGLRDGDLPDLLNVDVQLGADGKEMLLPAQFKPLLEGRDTYRLIVPQMPLEDLAKKSEAVTLSVDLGGGEPLRARYDLSGAVAALHALEEHQGWN